jgi:hypothetical protein
MVIYKQNETYINPFTILKSTVFACKLETKTSNDDVLSSSSHLGRAASSRAEARLASGALSLHALSGMNDDK